MRKNPGWRRQALLINTRQETKEKPSSRRWRNRTLSWWSGVSLLGKRFGGHWTWRRIWWLVGILVTIFCLLAVWSPYFRITTIHIDRKTPLVEIDALQQSLSPWYGRNLLFVSRIKIWNTIKNDWPALQGVKIREQWPQTLEIIPQLHDPAFTILNPTDASFYTLLSNGVALPQLTTTDAPTLRLVGYQEPIVLGKVLPFTSTQHINTIRETLDRLENEQGQLVAKIDWLVYAREAHFELATGVKIWIDLTKDVLPQLHKLVLIQSELDWTTADLQYLDLRIPNEVFYQ